MEIRIRYIMLRYMIVATFIKKVWLLLTFEYYLLSGIDNAANQWPFESFIDT